MIKSIHILIGFLIAFSINAITVSADVDKKTVKLIFSLDQGFGNGVVIHNDQIAIRRIIKTLNPLTKKYSVYLLLNPHIKNKEYVENTFETLKKYNMPFVLDVYTSDSYTLGSGADHNAPYDASHALSVSLDYLNAVKEKYGKLFAGIRFMEVFGQDFTVRCIKTTNPEWGRPTEIIPEDNVFSPERAEMFIKFASENDMFVQWADFHWYNAASYDVIQKSYEMEVMKLISKYPNIITITYNNNEPLEDSVPKLNTWHQVVEGFTLNGNASYGLSDQSWIRSDHMSTSSQEIINWAENALKHNCKLIQFEPVWYFFNLPVGTFGYEKFAHEPKWKLRGYGTQNYYQLQKSLLSHCMD